MSVAERYAHWYEHECDANDKMLAMIESVPVERRGELEFRRALGLAGHLAACRENWLDRMANDSRAQVDWWPEDVAIEGLRSRYDALQAAWRSYLSNMTDERLGADFEFPVRDGSRYRWNIEGQLVQLVGHAPYHRGQISMLVEALGGVTVDTDYLQWAYAQDSRWGLV